MAKTSNPLRLLKQHLFKRSDYQLDHSSCQFKSDKQWLNLQQDSNQQIKKPDELENEMRDPPELVDERRLDQIQGSLMGMALGDALGAHVEFRPHEYLRVHPVTDLSGGGTWNLKKGQFTDDTSMALCLAISLVDRRDFVAYDQLVRYKWWYEHGYMSSTGQCFDIGTATRQSLEVFSHRQKRFAKARHIPLDELDSLSDDRLLRKFKVYCSTENVAGNGALMRLAPVPLFFHQFPEEAVEFSGFSGQITHGDRKAYDACRYYGALIYAALNGYKKKDLLDNSFYQNHRQWFGESALCEEIRMIAEGSYKREGGYNEGIRGKGYIVNALEAALWAFWSDGDCFEKGVLAAVNLGDDTDTTAAIYGQLAGAYYGYKSLPQKWVKQVYAKKFIMNLSKWIAYEGGKWKPTEAVLPSHPSSKYTVNSSSIDDLTSTGLTLDYRQNRSNANSQTAPYEEKSFARKRFRFFGNEKSPPRSLPPVRRNFPPRRSGNE